jgi:deazaflavin-dependent oxidoreductase (nitroreductase family)
MRAHRRVFIVRRLLVPALALAGLAGLVAWWMRYTRIGAGFVNDVVNPYLVRRGLSGTGESELATLEHVGRRSGIRRLTPLHAITIPDGVRFAVPLGDRSEWARNVLAAGRCRMQYRDSVVELDEPRLLAPTEDPAMSTVLGRLAEWLGWRYLVLRRVADEPGHLEPVAEGPGPR